MVFLASNESGKLAPIPDSIPISEFMLNEKYGRVPHASSRDPYTCGLTGKSYSSQEVANHVDLLARSLSKEFGWLPNEGSEWDKTLAVFALNTVSVKPISKRTERSLFIRLVLRSTLCPYSGPFTDWVVFSLPRMHHTPPPSSHISCLIPRPRPWLLASLSSLSRWKRQPTSVS